MWFVGGHVSLPPPCRACGGDAGDEEEEEKHVKRLKDLQDAPITTITESPHHPLGEARQSCLPGF